MNTDNYIRIGRKLGVDEKTRHLVSNYVYITHLISSEINLYENLDIVKAGIRKWKNDNPVLRCTIFKKENEVNSKEESYHFAFKNSNEDKNEFINVRFLQYDSKQNKKFDDIWKLIIQQEDTIQISDNSLLWKLIFLQFKSQSNEDCSKFHYAIILKYDHSIFDGTSSYKSLLNLMAFIENTYLTNVTDDVNEDYYILPCKEDIFDEKLLKHPTQFIDSNYFDKAPAFFDLENSYKTFYKRLEHLTVDEENHGVIHHHDGTPYVTIKELIQISKCNKNRLETIIFNQEIMTKIMEKCKEHKTKVTSFLSMLMVLVMKSLFKKYDSSEEMTNKPIKIVNSINLRNADEFKRSFFIRNRDDLGVYVANAFILFKDELSEESDSWREDFWYFTKKDSIEFHNDIKDGRFNGKLDFGKPISSLVKDDLCHHFALSNFGIQKDSFTENKLIRVEQSFTDVRHVSHKLWNINSFLVTINNQLFWGIDMNSNVCGYFITDVIDNIHRIVQELIN